MFFMVKVNTEGAKIVNNFNIINLIIVQQQVNYGN
jgi:hypothetical protein